MAVHTVKRRGERRLVIDIRYTKPDGAPGRFRRDAEVQNVQAAHAEERRRLAALTLNGSPDSSIVAVSAPSEATPANEPKAAVVRERVEEEKKDPLPTFEVVAKEYLRAFAPSHLKPSTLFGYSQTLARFLVPRLKDLRIDEIDANVVREFDAVLVRKGAKPATRRNVQAILRSVLCRYAVEARLLDAPPAMPRLPKVGAKVANALTREEVYRLLGVSCTAHRLAFALAAFAGLRAGEIRGLRWRDVDLKSGQLVVRQTVCRGEISTPKSGHERVVPLAEELTRAISSIEKKPLDGRVSMDAYGRPWSEFSLGNAFRRACKRAELTGWRPHDLRHFFVTELFRRGAPAHAVQALAGHADLETTQKYAHVAAVDLRRAIAALNDPAVPSPG
jgi:integrase